MFEDIGNTRISFFINMADAAGKEGASMQAQTALPL
jgi:hypothetical protein